MKQSILLLLLVFIGIGISHAQEKIAGRKNIKPVQTALKAKPGPSVAHPAFTLPKMVYVSGGTFTMGCANEQGEECWNGEEPVHSVTLSSYYIGKYEVTQKEWEAVMGSNPSFSKGDNLPVEQVSWEDVQGFIKKLNAKTGKNYCLPTEAEWEFAARGGNKSNGYKYSGGYNADDVAWYKENSGDEPHVVGGKNCNELGIYDMSGNVWEWCSDWYGDYSSNPQTNPAGTSTGSYRVFRGGSWLFKDSYILCWHRGNDSPDHSIGDLGFRLALSPAQSQSADTLVTSFGSSKKAPDDIDKALDVYESSIPKLAEIMKKTQAGDESVAKEQQKLSEVLTHAAQILAIKASTMTEAQQKRLVEIGKKMASAMETSSPK